MTRPMRKEKHRMAVEDCVALLERAEVLRLGIVDADGPYVVPVNFGLEDRRLYVHGPLEGRRIDAVREGARVCFEVDEGTVIASDRPCGYSAAFESVIGYGVARLLADEAQKRRGLEVIMRHYGGPTEGMPAETVARTSVAEIVIESMDGKRYRPAASEGA